MSSSSNCSDNSSDSEEEYNPEIRKDELLIRDISQNPVASQKLGLSSNNFSLKINSLKSDATSTLKIDANTDQKKLSTISQPKPHIMAPNFNIPQMIKNNGPITSAAKSPSFLNRIENPNSESNFRQNLAQVCLDVDIKNIPLSLHLSNIHIPQDLVFLEHPVSLQVVEFQEGFNYKHDTTSETIQDLSYIIEVILKNSSKNKLLKDQEARAIIASLKDSQNTDVAKLLSLLELPICVLCKYPKVEFRLNCGHSFCKNCIKIELMYLTKGMLLLTEEEKNQEQPACQTCRNNYHANDYEGILRSKYDQAYDFLIKRESNQKIESSKYLQSLEECKSLNRRIQSIEKDPNRLNQCKSCLKVKHFPSFSLSDPCICICNDCLILSFYLGLKSCRVCKVAYNFEEILLKAGDCQVCKTEVYYIGDKLMSICDNHLHCSDCLQNAIAQKMCLVCSTKFSKDTRVDIKDIISTKCHLCKASKLRPEFYMKSCCPNEICQDCQSETEKCRFCGRETSDIMSN